MKKLYLVLEEREGNDMFSSLGFYTDRKIYGIYDSERLAKSTARYAEKKIQEYIESGEPKEDYGEIVIKEIILNQNTEEYDSLLSLGES